MTGRVEGLMNISGESHVKINPADAAKPGVVSGDCVEGFSRCCGVVVEAGDRYRGRKRDFHVLPFRGCPANKLTNTVIDLTARVPALKVCAAHIIKA